MLSRLFRERRRVLTGMLAIAGSLTLTTALGYTAPVAAAASGAHTVMAPRTVHAAPQAIIRGALVNHGGPVQTAPRVFIVFWDFTTDPVGEQAYMTRFLSTVGGSSWLRTVNQYGASSTISFGGTFNDNSAIPASPSDAQIQAEAQKAANHFGAGTSLNVEIVVATPTHHSTPGFGTQFCAYHGDVAADRNVTYTNMPYVTDAGAACGEGSVNGSAGTLDGVSIVEGHELSESLTDPLLNAWFDRSGNEIGDKCAFVNLANITTSGGKFAVQPLWSNAANNCVLGS